MDNNLTPVTVVAPPTTVYLINGITTSINTFVNIQVKIERRRTDVDAWDTVYDFGLLERVSISAGVELTFSTAYNQELTFLVTEEGIYRWNALVWATEAHPDLTHENFYSYFTSTLSYQPTSPSSSIVCDGSCSPILPTNCDTLWLEQTLEEYFCIRGFPVTIYLVTKFSPVYVFGEDPSKTYGASFTTRAIWDVSPENKNYGKFEKTSEEPLQLYLNISMVKKQIKEALLTAGIFSPLTADLPDTEVTKEEAWRRELQEQDMLRTDFNNIHYELDSVKKEPEYMYWLNKFVYWVTGRPRLVAGEELGDMQPVTDAEAIRQEHDTELAVESEKILF